MDPDSLGVPNIHEGQALPTGNALSILLDKLTQDTATHTTELTHAPADLNHSHAPAVISQIEGIFESIVDSILKEEPHMVIRLKTRYRPKNRVHDETSGVIRSLPDEETKAIQFPSRKPHEAWKFSR